MKPSPGAWGIDLGQCALKALRLQDIDGKLTVTAFDYIEYPKILNQPDADADQLTREAMEQFLSRNTLRGDTVAISVPGQSGLARFVKLPPVEEKKIADIVKFEAKQQIPFNLDEVVWDYQKLGAGEVVDGFALETEVGLFAMKRDIVNRFLQHFKDVNVEVNLVQMAPLALCNFLAYEMLGKDSTTPASSAKEPCVVGLDIGTDSSTLVITDGGRIIWQRAVALGGNHFTRALTKELKLTFAKAEHLKRNATKSGAAELKKVLGALKPVLSDFVGEVQRSLGYFTNTHRDAQIEYMVGLGNAFRLPGLQRYLSEKLQLEVRKIDKMSRLGGEEILTTPICQDNILSFGVAYGLCLQGLSRGRLVTNLLPGELRLERLIRSKKPWAVAAAGVLLVGLGAAALGSYLDQRPYKAESVKAAILKANEAKSAADAQEAAFVAARKAAQDEEEAVKAIVAGQAERLNWMHLGKFVSNCVPQPDGKNLPPESTKVYFDTVPTRAAGVYSPMSGAQAFEEYKTRLREGLKPPPEDKVEVDPLPRGIDDLVQMSIESVDARFCDDLSTYWKAATKTRQEGHVRPLDHFRKVQPEGKGWIVEVAGYTFHQRGENFVTATLLENISRLGIVKDVKPATPDAPPATPATPGSPAVDPDKDNKVPVVNRVSHVLLYRTNYRPAADSSNFEIINRGELTTLVGGAAGGGDRPGGPPGGAMQGGGSSAAMQGGGPTGGGGVPGGTGGETKPAAPSRTAWVSASTRGGGSGAGNSGAGGKTPGSIGSVGGSGRPGGSLEGGPAGGNSNQGNTSTTGTFGHVRTEFVILFIWKEGTPSDALRAGADPVPPVPVK